MIALFKYFKRVHMEVEARQLSASCSGLDYKAHKPPPQNSVAIMGPNREFHLLYRCAQQWNLGFGGRLPYVLLKILERGKSLGPRINLCNPG